MAATSQCFSPSISSFSSFITNNVPPFFSNRSNIAFKSSPIYKPSRLRISHRTTVTHTKLSFQVLAHSGLGDEFGPTSSEATTIDTKLPRRSLMVQFTCDSCGERTQRYINRLAYERGTVFVQCSGCLQHHKLVDNLNLVVEYDLREDTGVD